MAGPYSEQAYIPQQKWQTVSRALASDIWIDKPQEPKMPRCGVLKVPDLLLAPIREHIKGESETLREELRFLDRASIKKHTCILREYLCERLHVSDIPVEHGIACHPPGLETVTVNDKTGHFIGMHLDSWDGDSYEERNLARTRVSVNIGPSTRSFLFISLPLCEIAKLIAKATGQCSLTHAHTIMPMVFQMFPDIPVYRIELNPGEAYIADTDNLLHDGSSISSNSATLHYTLRAKLKI